MRTIAAIRAGLAANLGALPNLRVLEHVPDSISPPVAYCDLGSLRYDETMGRGLDQMIFRVTVVVGRASERAGQILLDALVDPEGEGSLKAAVESDPTLGGAAHDLRVTGLDEGYQVAQYGDVPYLQATWTVEIFF